MNLRSEKPPQSPQSPQSSQSSGGQDRGPGQPLAWWRHALWLLLVVAVAWYWVGGGTGQGVAEIPYTEFKRRVVDGEVAAVTFRGEVLTGRFTEGVEVTVDTGGEADEPSGGEGGEQEAPAGPETDTAGPQRFRTALPASRTPGGAMA